MKHKFNIQLFAAGENNNAAVRTYQPQFKGLLQAVFGAQSYFGDFFAGGLEALDGVQENDTAFSVKTSDLPVVFGEAYSTDANTAFGTGTGNSNRFGPRSEVIYTNANVPYSWGWTFHEGIDRHTVNNNFDTAVADRLEQQAKAKVKLFNAKHSQFIAASAGKTETLTDYSANSVLALFNALTKHFTNVEAVGNKKVKVNSDLYNAIVDHPLTTTAKSSGANVDENGILKFKGFSVQNVPDSVLPFGVAAYAYIEGVAKAFTGINTARTVESEDFDGVALQGAGKAGEYIPKDNKKAVVKVIMGAAINGQDTLTVTSAAGTASGDTKITVSPALTAGNSYKYKVAANAAMPVMGQSVRTWANWDGSADITAETGKEIVIVECDASYRAVKAGMAVVTAKA